MKFIFMQFVARKVAPQTSHCLLISYFAPGIVSCLSYLKGNLISY